MTSVVGENSHRTNLEHLVGVCRRIFDLHPGLVENILTIAVGGVRLRFTDERRQAGTRYLLDRLGYATHVDSASPDVELIVTGWSYEALVGRVRRMDEAVRQLRDERSQVPNTAVRAYLAYLTTYNYSTDNARQETIDATQRNVATRLPSLGQPLDVLTDDDLLSYPVELADLLGRIRDAQTELRDTEDEHVQLAVAAIEKLEHLRIHNPGVPVEQLIPIVQKGRGST